MATRPECSRAESNSRSATLAWRMRSVTGTCSSFSMSAWVRIFIDVSSYSTRHGTDVARPSRACRPLCKSNLPSTRECHVLHRTTGRSRASVVRGQCCRGARPDGGAHSGPSRTRGSRRRLAANAAGQRRGPEIGRHGPPLPAGQVRRLRSRYAERCRSLVRRGPRLRLERLVPGPASHPQFHARRSGPTRDSTTYGQDPACLVSGIFIPACGRGRRVEGGYVLSGRWPLVSGVNTSDWCLFAAFTEEDGVDVAPLLRPAARARSRSSIPGDRSA